MSTSKTLLTLIAGAAAGATLGVLYAPAKGTVTRRKLVRSGNAVVGDVQDQFNEYVDSISDSLATMKSSVGEMFESGTKTAAHVTHKK